MTTQKKKKSAKEKRVLIGSVVVATAIVAGSTFAWFSSKDEVTNRLTASADYNVSIVEDFNPPKDWIPGQTINKDVSAVNTGNVDAFVRMWLGGAIRVLTETDTDVEDTTAIDATNPGINNSTLTAVDDASKTKLGLKYYKGGKYYKVLSKDKIANPNDANHPGAETSDPTGTSDNQPAGFSEVQSMQAAGVLVYAPADAVYTWSLEQAADMWVYSGADAEPTLTPLAKGTKVGSVYVTENGVTKIAATSNKTTANERYYGSIDASTFKPETTGLYLFRRNIGETLDGTANQYEYSGYYYESTTDEYFALHTDTGANGHSDYVLPAGVINDNSRAATSKDQVLPVTIETGKKVYLYTAEETLAQTDDLTWTYNVSEKKFTVTKEIVSDKPITIEIALAEDNVLGESDSVAPDKWKPMVDPTAGTSNKPQKTTFYYTNDLEAGDTTKKLIDSVTLSNATKNDAYLALDFDLNVFLDSVQVTMDEEGKEGAVTVADGWGTDVSNLTGSNDTSAHPIIAAKGTATVENGEITKIAWS